MKKLNRDPERFDVLELYSTVSPVRGYQIGVEADLQDFHERMQRSLKTALDNPALLHGKRVESMFAYVVGALGQCDMIKQEDSGALFVNNNEITVPDYRIVTKTGETMLVEVKNFRMRSFNQRFTMKKLYLSKLQKYADMNNVVLKFAIYFSGINHWILLSPASFVEDGKLVFINFPLAIARNEMAVLGDRMINTLSPLVIKFIGDITDERSRLDADGKALFTIRQIEMTCNGKRIDDDVEKQIAFYLMRYGSWVADGIPASIIDGKLKSFQFSFSPEHPSELEEQPFDSLGNLSSMVSSAFRELTVTEKGVVSLDVRYDPAFFELNIPIDYKGDALPLWQFILKPNMEFEN